MREVRRYSDERSDWIEHLEVAGNGSTTVPIIHARSARLLECLASGTDPFSALLHVHGAMLLRGLGFAEAAPFQKFVEASGMTSRNYDYASTPRSRVGTGVFSSTDYPAGQTIPQHNEQSYTSCWPGRIWFHCVVAPADRGATPLADSRQILANLDPAIRHMFADRGIRYVRNFGTGLDLDWPDVFGTDDISVVESFCAANGIALEWLEQGRLRTSQSCQTEIIHPVTGDAVWFNQAHLFHVTALAPELREMLLSVLGERDLPRNAYFGDGGEIPAAALSAVRATYDAATIRIPWQEGDVLLLDNMLMSHGREPFSGSRKILVAMTHPHQFDPITNRVMPAARPLPIPEAI